MKRFFVASLFVIGLATSAFGASITNITVTGMFHDPTDDTAGVNPGDPAVTPAGAATVTKVAWGIPPGAPGVNPQSSYVFTSQDVAGPIAINPPNVTGLFTLGNFVHDNFIVDSPVLTSVMLDVNLSFLVDGSPFAKTFTYLLQHTETDNFVETNPASGNCPFPTPVGEGCTDRVLISGGAPQFFTLGGVNFTMNLSFLIGGNPVNSFVTRENLSNSAVLVGQFAAANSVPEPGTFALMGAALVGLGFAAKRRGQHRS